MIFAKKTGVKNGRHTFNKEFKGYQLVPQIDQTGQKSQHLHFDTFLSFI